jgi:tRNA U34 5-methylaminomethyl-2-thiouridine-forming methyltransferase MnmC
MKNFNSVDEEELQLVTSEDGSNTLFVPRLNEHYHSTYGAIQESKHIFIEAGLRKAMENHQKIHLLEVGFGTGLNAMLTYLFTFQNKVEIAYTGIEAYPLNQNIFSQLNYHHLLEATESEVCFREICFAEWDQSEILSENFKLTKLHNTIQDAQLQTNEFNLVYFDAFSPEAQPEMWTEDIFRKLFLSMDKGGILVTYCCKGIVKRALKSAGFQIEKLPGPPGKREILRALK